MKVDSLRSRAAHSAAAIGIVVLAVDTQGHSSPPATYQSVPFAGIRDGLRNGPALEVSFVDLRGVAVDSGGNAVLADRGGHRIAHLSAASQVTTRAGTGVSGSADGPAALATFHLPS